MPTFVSAFCQLASLTDSAITDLKGMLHTKSYDKGEKLLSYGERCKRLYFIDEGLTKTFFSNESKEFIMRFFSEYALFTVVDSFTAQTPSHYEILALEKTSVTYINQQDLEALCKKHHCIESAFRKLLSIATTNMMKRISEMLEENATERYNRFLRDNGQLLQRISLGDLSCYLGITQVSLSRIRSGK
ncbi:MAG: Crp/Fnr family transcriptional regulator [Chitinophagales bacterium]|nr:Crp/Fnr family transcriptional regulator [Chitinophagales bacterium]